MPACIQVEDISDPRALARRIAFALAVGSQHTGDNTDG